MKEQQLFAFLKHQPSSSLLSLLERAYRLMSVDQRGAVFGRIVKRLPSATLKGQDAVQRVMSFRNDSLAGKYYAPFEINSKNFTHVPEETEEWFEELGDLLGDSVALAEQGAHAMAVECFGILYELIRRMENGEEIVFADELGSWMIPGDEKKRIVAYLSSLAAVTPPESFAATVIPLVRRDSLESFCNRVYAVALRVASKEQRECLKAEVSRQNIKTKSSD